MLVLIVLTCGLLTFCFAQIFATLLGTKISTRVSKAATMTTAVTKATTTTTAIRKRLDNIWHNNYAWHFTFTLTQLGRWLTHTHTHMHIHDIIWRVELLSEYIYYIYLWECIHMCIFDSNAVHASTTHWVAASSATALASLHNRTLILYLLDACYRICLANEIVAEACARNKFSAALELVSALEHLRGDVA